MKKYILILSVFFLFAFTILSCNFFQKDVIGGDKLLLKIVLRIRGSNSSVIQFSIFQSSELKIETGEIEGVQMQSDGSRYSFNDSIRFLNKNFEKQIKISNNNFEEFKILIAEFNRINNDKKFPVLLKGASDIYFLSEFNSIKCFIPKLLDLDPDEYLVLLYKFVLNQIPVKYRFYPILKHIFL